MGPHLQDARCGTSKSISGHAHLCGVAACGRWLPCLTPARCTQLRVFLTGLGAALPARAPDRGTLAPSNTMHTWLTCGMRTGVGGKAAAGQQQQSGTGPGVAGAGELCVQHTPGRVGDVPHPGGWLPQPQVRWCLPAARIVPLRSPHCAPRDRRHVIAGAAAAVATAMLLVRACNLVHDSHPPPPHLACTGAHAAGRSCVAEKAHRARVRIMLGKKKKSHSSCNASAFLGNALTHQQHGACGDAQHVASGRGRFARAREAVAACSPRHSPVAPHARMAARPMRFWPTSNTV